VGDSIYRHGISGKSSRLDEKMYSRVKNWNYALGRTYIEIVQLLLLDRWANEKTL
jgi:hypothetical protein